MPGPGTGRDRLGRGGMFRDVATSGTPAVGSATVRLREELDGWRRHISRRQSVEAARLWSLITLGTALAGVAAGRIDGSLLVTAVAATALPVMVGAVIVVRRRRVSAEDAARQLDAAFGFDEQVATALCCAEAGAAVAAGMTDHNRLVAELIERAAELVAETGGVPRPVPAYGDWAAIAVTAAAVAAVAAVPGPHGGALTTAAGGPGRGSLVAGPTAHGSAHAGGIVSGKRGTPDARVTSGDGSAPTVTGASAKDAATGGTRPGATAGASRPGAAGGGTRSGTGAGTRSTASATDTPSASATDTPTESATGIPSASATEGAGAGRSRSAAVRGGGSGQGGAALPAAGQSTRSPTAQSGTTRAAMTPRGATQAGNDATGGPGTAARNGGLGDAAGTEPGNNGTNAHPTSLPSAGIGVLLIVLPGGDGTGAVPGGQEAPGQQPAGGGTSTATPTATAPGNSAEYVPPDQNEVPFPDQGVLGRYF